MKDLSQSVSRHGPARPALATNVLFKILADGISKLVTLVVMLVAARALSAIDFGVLALAMTTGWILSVASDAGLPIYLAKRVAAATARQAPSLAIVADVMRARIAFGATAALVGLALAFAIAPDTVLAFAIIVMAQLLTAILETLSHAYRGLRRTNIESALVMSHRIATAAAVVLVLAIAPSLTMLSIALAVPPALALLVSWRIARMVTGVEGVEGTEGVEGRQSAARRTVRAEFAIHVAPLGLAAVLSAVYFRCDVYFVQIWHGVDTVGIYNAAFRIVEALRTIPAAVLAVWFAPLCASKDLRAVRRLTALLGAGGVALFVVVYAAAPTMLELMYGARFVAAASALRILSLAVPLFFVNYALTHQVIAWDGQRAFLAITAAALAANLTANCLLIPGGGMVGAALATLLTEVVVTIGCIAALVMQTDAVRRQPFALVSSAEPQRAMANRGRDAR